MEDAPKYMTTREVAAYFRVEPKTIRQWAHQGRIRYSRTLGGGPFRFREADVQALADETSRPGGPTPPQAGPGPGTPTPGE